MTKSDGASKRSFDMSAKKMMDDNTLHQLAHEAGLDAVGVVSAGPTPAWSRYLTWLHNGYAAGMDYLARPDALTRRADPRTLFAHTKSVLVVSVSYDVGRPPELYPFEGSVARYAWGEDYHRWMLARLQGLVDSISKSLGLAINARCYVDTGAIVERSWAVAAGLGWIGKNACLIHPQLGSFTFLGVALLDRTLRETEKKTMPTCGTCTRCLDACPTGALVQPGVVDANRCLSYLTIEHRGVIPEQLRQAVGQQIFGCDVCQNVCPWNQREKEPVDSPVLNTKLDVRSILSLDQAGFREQFRATSLWRAKLEGLARNAAIVLGNQQTAEVRYYLENNPLHPNPVVQEHLEWARQQHRIR